MWWKYAIAVAVLALVCLASAGRPEGMAFDLVRYIGRELGLPMDFDGSTPWKRMLALLEIGKLDMVTENQQDPARGRRKMGILEAITNSYLPGPNTLLG